MTQRNDRISLIRRYAAFSILFLSLPSSVLGQHLTIDIINQKCETRNETSRTYQYIWKVTDSVDHHPKAVSEEIKKAWLKIDDTDAEKIALQTNITDPKIIERNKSSFRRSRELSLEPKVYHSEWNITIIRTPDLIHASGTTIAPDTKTQSKKHQYFGHQWAMCFEDSSHDTLFGKITPISPYIVGSSFDSIYSQNGDAGLFNTLPLVSFNVSPILYSFLIGTNPLKTYSGEWKRQESSSNPNPQFALITNINQQRYLQRSMTLDLDSNHDNAPLILISKSLVNQKVKPAVYRCEHFRKLDGIWIADKVVTEEHLGDTSYHRIYTLMNVSKSLPIHIEMPEYIRITAKKISDFRLFGNDLSNTDLNRAFNFESRKDRVDYKWDGHVPSIEELRKLQIKNKPQVSDSNPIFKFWMFIPGVILIGVGIYLKLRKSKIDKKNGVLPKA